jgi:hypothetical protein
VCATAEMEAEPEAATALVWVGMLTAARRRQSRRTPKVLGGLLGRASTKPPTPPRGSGACARGPLLRGDLKLGADERLDSLLAGQAQAEERALAFEVEVKIEEGAAF